MGKTIIWNNVKVRLPSNWEVVSEGGSRINGVLVFAPVEGAKYEVYWREGRKNYVKEHDRYVKRLMKKGYRRIREAKLSISKHQAVEDVLEGRDTKVFVATWYCNETNRLFIAQLDGVKASQGLFIDLLNNTNCHPVGEVFSEWVLMGIGLKLYNDYFLVDRLFKIGYSMAYFMSRDRKVHVIQYSIPRYVYESSSFNEEDLFNRHLKRIVPRFTRLVSVKKDTYNEYIIVHSLIKYIKYGYLLEKKKTCSKPDYIQYTIIKTPGKRLEEAREIISNTRCVEW